MGFLSRLAHHLPAGEAHTKWNIIFYICTMENRSSKASLKVLLERVYLPRGKHTLSSFGVNDLPGLLFVQIALQVQTGLL